MTKEELEKEAEVFATYYESLFPNEFETFYKAFLKVAEPREKHIAELEKENAELKGLKDVATLIRANNDTVTTLMQLNNMLVSKSQQLTKAKDIIEKLRALYLSPVVTKDDVKRQNEILNEVEQFLKDSEVENV